LELRTKPKGTEPLAESLQAKRLAMVDAIFTQGAARENRPTNGIIQSSGGAPLLVAVIDGPYDSTTLVDVFARAPIELGNGSCGINPGKACDHGTFIMGILGARRDAAIPGLCPGCQLLHVPLFLDDFAPGASIEELAHAITVAVTAGARLINLSLAIIGAETQINRKLGAALDYAEASGAILVVAAGNQSRLANGQLLSHSVTIPVVAVDAAQRPLPDCNFGPEILQHGVAALGHHVVGYAPRGGTAAMSGTSVASAVATGILAEVWSVFPDLHGADIRVAVAQIEPRGGPTPPILDRNRIFSALDRTSVAPTAAVPLSERGKTNHASLQGEMTMNVGNGQPKSSNPSVSPTVTSDHPVIPANGSAGCACGAPGGICTCNANRAGPSGFVYALGTVEAEYPNVAVEREMQTVAHGLGMQTGPTDDRSWQYAVLNANRDMTRYIARQLSWRLTIEDFPAFVLRPGDCRDFDMLINCLSRPKYLKQDGSRNGKKKAKESSIESPLGPPQDLDVVIGVTAGQTPNGMAVLVDQIFTIPPERLAPGGLGVFAQLSDNYGLTDEDRAYNFLAARYTIPREGLNEIEKIGLVGVPIISSRLSGDTGRVVRVIFTLKGTNTQMEKKYFVRVDVTHRFPFLVTPWHPYLERGEMS
jgi:hypothetical protein